MIDYFLINESLEHYESDGFERVEVPWLVTSETDNITKPEGVEPFIVSSKNKNLIASGEQGNPIMLLLELSDMLGAIESYLEKHHPSINLIDLIKMSDRTKEAFKSEHRK